MRFVIYLHTLNHIYNHLTKESYVATRFLGSVRGNHIEIHGSTFVLYENNVQIFAGDVTDLHADGKDELTCWMNYDTHFYFM